MLAELGLEGVAQSQVGGSSNIRGVSGGERRRVTIGMELVIDPAILILDEPTSGLDSYTAVNLMRTLKQACQLSDGKNSQPHVCCGRAAKLYACKQLQAPGAFWIH